MPADRSPLRTLNARWLFLTGQSLLFNVAIWGFGYFYPWGGQQDIDVGYVLALGLASVLISAPFIVRYRRREEQAGPATDPDENARVAARLSLDLFTGAGFAELPLLCGIFNYVLTGDLATSAALGFAAPVLQLFYKPSARWGSVEIDPQALSSR